MFNHRAGFRAGPVDHYVKEVLRYRGCPASLRFLPKMAKTRIFSTGENTGFLGYRCLRSCRRLERDNVMRAMRRLRAAWRAVEAGRMEERTFHSSLMAWYGHAARADTKTLLSGLHVWHQVPGLRDV